MARVSDTAPLTISVEADGQQLSLTLTGKADFSNISDVVAVLDRLADEHERCVSLDLSGLESMDTDALKGLAGSAGAFRERRKRLHLKEASNAVHNLLDKFHLSEIFCVKHKCAGGCNPITCGIAAEAWITDVFTLPCDITQCQEARMRVDRVAEAIGFDMCMRSDIKLAVGEAVANAVKYGYTKAGMAQFTVSCFATPEKLCVSVSDNGPGFSFDNLPSFEESLFMEHGRGIHCMNAVMDEVTFQFEVGTTVRMVKQK